MRLPSYRADLAKVLRSSPARGLRREQAAETVGMADHYANGTYLWWHLSRPSPELVAALADGWLHRTRPAPRCAARLCAG
jgi:hypothetical protein